MLEHDDAAGVRAHVDDSEVATRCRAIGHAEVSPP
jgi:hypothetical protein